MSIINFCFWFSSISVVIGALCIYLAQCESEEVEPDEQEPIPELNDFEEAYTLFEHAKTTYNPLAYLPLISTTNKEIAEYLLLRGGVSKWRRTISVTRGLVDQPACVVHRIRKDGSIKHELFKEKNIKIKKEFGTYEEHICSFQYNWGANRKRIEMLKCPCVLGSRGYSSPKRQSMKSYFVDEGELAGLAKNGKKVKLRIIPTTRIVSRNRQIHVASNRSRDDGLSSIDEYPYQSSEEDSLRAASIRLQERVSAKCLLDRDICINGHVFLGRGINGDNSFFVFARDRGFLRVVAHLVLK